MDQSFVGTIYMFGGNFAPRNFALCNGALASIAENEVLYTLLGTTYGGDGVQTFGLPDLRGKLAIGYGQGPGLNNYVIGQAAGTESVTLTVSNMAAHNHFVNVNTAAATLATPAANCYLGPPMNGTASMNFYTDAAPDSTLTPTTIGTAGGSQPLSILQPVLAVTYVITLFGIFPSQN